MLNSINRGQVSRIAANAINTLGKLRHEDQAEHLAYSVQVVDSLTQSEGEQSNFQQEVNALRQATFGGVKPGTPDFALIGRRTAFLSAVAGLANPGNAAGIITAGS